MSVDPKPLTRKQLAACGAALAFLLIVRLLASRYLAYELTEGEELLNLRLAAQVRGGFPIGDLGRYWYTGAGGNTGAGTLVMSLLYVPLGLFAEPDVWACRLLATGWCLLGAISLAGLGRSLLGPGGAVAGLVGYALSAPAWLTFSLTAWGNYTEAAALSLLALWLLAAGRGPRAAAGLGFVGVFSIWFNYSAAPASSLALLLGLWSFRRQPRALAALFGGASLAALPWIIGVSPAASVASPLHSAALSRLLRHQLGQPGSWPGMALQTLAAMPVLQWNATEQEWGPPLLELLRVPWKLLAWGSLLGAAAWLLRAGRAFEPRAAVLALLAAAVASPLALTALGTGPEELGLPQLYFWDPRRAAIVYPAWGLALGWAGWLAWRAGRAGQIVVALAVVVAAGAQLVVSISGPPPPSPFRPAQYLICPAEQPVQQGPICIGALLEDMAPPLEALIALPEFADVELRAAALAGYGALDREDEDCLIGPTRSPSHSVDPVSRAAWFGLGAGAAPCPGDGGEDLCNQAPDPVLRDACFAGRDFGEEHTPQPDDYEEKMKLRGEQP